MHSYLVFLITKFNYWVDKLKFYLVSCIWSIYALHIQQLSNTALPCHCSSEDFKDVEKYSRYPFVVLFCLFVCLLRTGWDALKIMVTVNIDARWIWNLLFFFLWVGGCMCSIWKVCYCCCWWRWRRLRLHCFLLAAEELLPFRFTFAKTNLK